MNETHFNETHIVVDDRYAQLADLTQAFVVCCLQVAQHLLLRSLVAMSVGRRHGDRIWQYACEKCGRERLVRCKVRSGEVWSFNPGLVTERVRMELGKSWDFNYQTYVRYSSVSIKNFCCDYVHTDQVDCFHRFAKETELHLHDA